MSESVALFQAIQAGDAATVTDLIEARAELLSASSPSGLSPLLFAAYYHRPQMAALLMGLGAGVSVFEAAAVGAEDRLLVMLEADPALLHAHSPDGFSLLGLACSFGHEAAARALLALGADVNTVSRNAMRVTPLHSAAAGEYPALAALLLAAGANVDAVQHGGYTPLHSAAQNGNLPLARLLLEQGADPATQTDEGQTAQALATENGHAEVALLLAGDEGTNINTS